MKPDYAGRAARPVISGEFTDILFILFLCCLRRGLWRGREGVGGTGRGGGGESKWGIMVINGEFCVVRAGISF